MRESEKAGLFESSLEDALPPRQNLVYKMTEPKKLEMEERLLPETCGPWE